MSCGGNCSCSGKAPHPHGDEALVDALLDGAGRAQSTRRGFLKTLASAATSAAAASAAGCTSMTFEEFTQQHYKQLDDDDKRALIARIQRKARDRYGIDVEVHDPQPVEGVEYAYGLNLSYCIGCRRCEYACAAENNTPNDPDMHYIRVLEIDKGTMGLEHSTTDFDGEVPKPDKYYMPVQCHQCDNPPCVKACPVQATWKESDGIVAIDYDWCIGCRYCEAACPYAARRFNFSEPSLRASEINPVQGLLSNRIRPAGVVEKCHFCLHRVREGRYPACLEVCPTGARKFGNLLDPESEVRKIIETKRIYVFKEELGTIPRFFYFFD